MMEISKRDVNLMIEFLRRNDIKAAEIHRMLQTAWGDQYDMSERRVREIVKEFSDGERTSFERIAGSGRRQSDTRLVLVDRVREEIKEDPHLSCRRLATNHGVSRQMIYDILTVDLGLVSVSDRYVPHKLSDFNKQNRVTCCKEILKAMNTRTIKRRLVHTDEKWFYSRSMGSPSTRSSWVSPDGDYPTTPRRTPMDKKMMALIACNFEGLSYSKVLEVGETVNSEVYITFLEEAFAAFNIYELRQMGKAVIWETAVLYHDNARPHVSAATNQFLDAKNCVRLRQPPYSPDTNILDRFVFPKLEMERSSIQFDTTEQLRQFLREGLQRNTEQMLSRQFEKLRMHYQNVIDHDGNYIV